MVSHGVMNCARLESMLRDMFSHVLGDRDQWRVQVDDLDIYVMADEFNDRVRIMIPVAAIERTDNDLLWVLLHSNYDRALDARYAVHDGVVWTTFFHRLSWLNEAEVENALQHVITLAKTTGSSFCSSDLVFGQG